MERSVRISPFEGEGEKKIGSPYQEKISMKSTEYPRILKKKKKLKKGNEKNYSILTFKR